VQVAVPATLEAWQVGLAAADALLQVAVQVAVQAAVEVVTVAVVVVVEVVEVVAVVAVMAVEAAVRAHAEQFSPSTKSSACAESPPTRPTCNS